MKNIFITIFIISLLLSGGFCDALLHPFQGGTGIGSYNRGDLIMASSTDELTVIATGTEGHILTIVSGIPDWAAAAGGSLWTDAGSFTYLTASSSNVVFGDDSTTTAPFLFDVTNGIFKNAGWYSGDGDAEGIYIDNTGQVGVGTTTPEYTLDVEGSLGVLTGIDAATGTFSGALTSATLNTGHGDNELWGMDQDLQSSNSPTFSYLTITNGLTAATSTIGTNFVIDSSGNASTTGGLTIGATSTFSGWVGISTSTPAYTLDVWGDLRVYATSTLATTTISDLTVGTIIFPTSTGTTGYVLKQQADGSLDWAADADTGGIWTDGGSMAYLTATGDDLGLGNSASSSCAFYVDVSTGDLVITGGLTIDTAYTGIIRADSGVISTTTDVGSLNAITGAVIIAGTANQITVASSSQTITLSTPQDIAAASSPTFAGLTLSGVLNGFMKINASGVVSTSTIDISADTNLVAGRSLSTSTAGTIDADAELYTDTKCIWFEDPTAADDFKSIWRSSIAITFTKIWAESDQTVTFNLQEDDGSPGNILSASLAPAAGIASSTSFADASFAADSRLDLVVDSVANTPTWVSVCFTYTKND